MGYLFSKKRFKGTNLLENMKIAIFTDNFPPQLNGAVTATMNLIMGLARRGHKIYVFAPNFPNISKEFSHKNVIIKRIPSIPAGFYPDFRFTNFLSIKLLYYLKKEKIQLIQFPSPITLGLQAIILAKILKIPLIGTFHTFFADPQYLKHVKLDTALVQHLGWYYSKLFYNSCSLITCPSETTKKELLRKGFTKRIRVISNGIDGKIFDNSKYLQVRKKYSLGGPLVLFVGRVSHDKNIFYLIDCFKLVIKEMPNARLLIVGDGPQFTKVKEIINKEDLSRNILLLGRVEHQKLVKSSLFKACDLFVTASITENQPMTILEAQINGLVCIGINKKGMKDLIKDGYNGYLIKDGDKKGFAKKIILALSNKRLMQKMKENTLAESKKNDLDNVIDIWEEELKLLINAS